MSPTLTSYGESYCGQFMKDTFLKYDIGKAAVHVPLKALIEDLLTKFRRKIKSNVEGFRCDIALR